MKKRLKQFILILLIVLAVLAGSTGLAFLYANSDAGRARIARLLEDNLSGGGARVEIQAVEGSLPSWIELVGIRVADSRGVWLLVDRARLKWRPLRLFDSLVAIEELSADTVNVARKPEASDEPGKRPAPGGAGGPPPVPFAVSVDRFGATRVHLGESLLGSEAVFSVDGTATLKKLGEQLDLRLDVRRIDDTPGSLNALAAYHPASRVLTLDIRAHEPPGGLAVRTAGVPGHPELSLSLAGRGPIEDWAAKLKLHAGDDLDVAGEMKIRESAPGRFTLDGAFVNNVQALLADELKPLAGRAARLEFLLSGGSGEPIVIERFNLAAPGGEARLGGQIAPDMETLDLTFNAMAGPADLFSPWLAGASWKTLSAKGALVGNTDRPETTVNLLVENFAGFDHRFGRADINLSAAPESRKDPAGAMRVSASGALMNLSGADPEIARFAGERVDLALKGRVLAREKRIDIQSATVRAALGELAFLDTEARHWGKALDLKARIIVPNLGPLSSLAGQPLAGGLSAELEGQVVKFGESGEGKAVIVTDGLKTGIATADALLSATTRLSLAGGIDARHKMKVDKFLLEAPGLQASARGALEPDESISGEWSVTLKEIATVAKALAVPLKGDIEAKGGVLGSLAAPRVSARAASQALSFQDIDITGLHADFNIADAIKLTEAEGRIEAARVATPDAALSAVKLDLAAGNLTGNPSGRVAADVTLNEWPVLASTNFKMNDGNRLALDRLDVVALGAHVAGALDVALDNNTASGTLNGEIIDTALLSRLIDQNLDGTFRFKVVLANPNRQDVTLRAQAKDIRLDRGETLAVASARLNALVTDAMNKPGIEAALEAGGLAAPGAEVSTLALSATGSAEKLAYTLKAEGRVQQIQKAVFIESTGEATALEDVKRLLVRTLSGKLGETPFKLTRPATLATSGRENTIKDFELLLDKDSRLSADATLAGETLSARARVQKLPLSLLRLIGQEPPVSGLLEGALDVAGTRAAPDAKLNLTLANIDFGKEAAVLGAGEATLRGRLKNKDAAFTGRFEQAGVGYVDFEASLPVDLTLAAPVSDATPLDGEAKGIIDLDFLNQKVLSDVHNLKGKFDLDAKLGGTLKAARVTGSATLSGGSYENLNYGTLLDLIELRIEADDEHIHLPLFKAATPEGGSLTGSGDLKFTSGDMLADFHFSSKKARLVAIDSLTGSVSSDLAFTGSMKSPWLKGSILVDKVEAFIPENLPPSVVLLDVTEEKKAQKADASKKEEESPASGEPPTLVNLDLDIDVPGRVYVRGRGLDTELEGKFRVTGTHAAPNIDGNLKMRHGTLNVLNRQFKFSRGQVAFDGVPKQEPTLNFKADAKPVPDAKMAVMVTGPASKPAISLWSEPVMPQDEILSRILFGKSAGAISAIEAVELAASLATLSGASSGPGVMDKVRRSLGLDTLKFSGGEEGAGPGVEAGRYIAEGVYLGVEQGLDSEASRATIEVEVTPNITLESDIGADSQSRVGINMEWDY